MITREFAEQVKANVERIAGCNADIKYVWKNNGLKMTGITLVEDESKASPTVYLELMSPGSASETAEEVVRTIRQYKESSAEGFADNVGQIVKDKERLLERVLPRLVNYEWNKDFLQTAPHRKFLDLAITYVVELQDEGTTATAKALNAHDNVTTEAANTRSTAAIKATKEKGPTTANTANTQSTITEKAANEDAPTAAKLVNGQSGAANESWAANGQSIATTKVMNGWLETSGATEEELYGAAMRNVKERGFTALPLGDVLRMIEAERKIMEQITPADVRIIVLSNEDCLFGANVMCVPEIIETVAEAEGADLIILPSSLHEVLAIPMDGMFNVSDLRLMVMEVNGHSVPLEDKLSDNVYIFDRQKKSVRIAEM